MTRVTRWAGVLLSAQVLFGTADAALAIVPEPSEDQFRQIQTAFLQEQFDRVVELTRGLQPPAGDAAGGGGHAPRVWLWYALSLDRLQRTTEALDQIDQLKQSLSSGAGKAAVPNDLLAEALFWDGEISRKAFQMMRARRAYRKLLAQYPNSSWKPQAQLGLAFVQFHQQGYDESLQTLQDVIKLPVGPSIVRQARLLQGLCSLQLKRDAQAQGQFEALLKDALDLALRAQVNFYLGEALSSQGEFVGAISAYLRAIEADPDSAWARLGRFGIGWSYFQQRRCRESLDVFNASRKPDPAWPRAELLFAEGQCSIALQDDASASERLQELLRTQPDHALAIDGALSLAELFERQHRLPEARAVLESVSRRSLTGVPAQRVALRLGSVLLAQGQADQAAEQLDRAAQTNDPELRQAAWVGRGDLAVYVGRVEQAVQAYEQAIRTAPESERAWYATYQIGRLQFQSGQTREAVEAFRQVAEHAGPLLAADARLALAFAYLSNAQPDLARVELDYIRQHLSGSSHAARAGYYAALLALRDGHVNEAKALCRDVIDRAPQTDEAFEARLLLADLAASQDSPDEALASLRQTYERLSGGNEPLAGVQRGRMLSKLGDLAYQASRYNEAIGWYESARGLLPAKQGELDYRLASCYEEAGDAAVALSRYRAIAQTPWSVRGKLAAAKLLERDARWQEALGLYDTVARQPVPEAKIAEEHRAELTERLAADKPTKGRRGKSSKKPK